MFKADFYIDKRWIGSIKTNGEIWLIPSELLIQVNKTMFEELAIKYIEENNGIVAKNEINWPWLWNNSKMTDYSYIFDTNHEKVLMSIEGEILLNPIKIQQGYSIIESNMYLGTPDFPDMQKNILSIRNHYNG